MKELCYKTVRFNGESVWAPNITLPGDQPITLGRTYEIGQTYEFPVEFPAHVYKDPEGCDLGLLRYDRRPESSYGNRLLICLAEDLVRIEVNLFPFWDPLPFADSDGTDPDIYRLSLEWFLRGVRTAYGRYGVRYIYTTTRLEVIGEVFPPLRDTERPKPRYLPA